MRQIWAIAKNLILEILKIKALTIFIVLLTLGYTVGFAWWLHTSDGLADEKIKTFLSYSLSLTSAVLALLTIFVSIATITRDIKRREIFTIATKPISRGQFLLGKFLGMALFNLVLLALNGLLIYTTARTLQITETAIPTSQNKAAALRLNELVFVARTAVPAPSPNVSQQVKKRVDELVAQKQAEDPRYRTDATLVGQLRRELIPTLTQQFTLRENSVPPGYSKVWHFTGLEPIDPLDGYVFIRYKQEPSRNPPDLTIWNQWRTGPQHPGIAGGRDIPLRKDVVRTFHEFGVPVTDVSPEGEFYLAYRNPPVNAPVTAIFPSQDGPEVLYVAGSFEDNFLRTLAAIYLRLLFLGIVGLAAGAWLSFPVGVLLVMVIYTMGLATGFISDAVRWETSGPHADFIRLVMALFPNFSAYDPVPQIEKGRIGPWQMLVNASLSMLLLKGGIAAAIGYLIFKFRELARVIV